MATISVLVADGQRLFAEALAITLRDDADLQVIDDYPTSGLKAVEAVLRYAPDVALIDYWTEGMRGPAATRAILARSRRQKVMVLSWFDSPSHVQNALEAGAVAFLPKTLSVEEVAEAIRVASSGTMAPQPPPALKLVTSEEGAADSVWDRLVTLTPREVEILGKLKIHGQVKPVAEELSISEGTLRVHVHKILEKLNVRSQIEAIAVARRHGLI